MDIKDTGGQVYPVHERVYVGDGIHEDVYHDGLTLRDYFAGQALAGICAEESTGGTNGMIYEDAAKYSYGLADAMIKEKNK
jgi:hypothetical protein